MTEKGSGGIQVWMSSIRASMANDPCRQLFEDQVQTHAFLFLDDYLDNITAGPQQAYVQSFAAAIILMNCSPIIDLVKTPSRKKNVPRRTKVATTEAAKLLEFESDTRHEEYIAMLEPPLHTRGNELSVIAEGDESPERHTATTPSPVESAARPRTEFERAIQFEGTPTTQIELRDISRSDPVMQEESVPETVNVTTSFVGTLHSISIGPPDQGQDSHAKAGDVSRPLPGLVAPSSNGEDTATAQVSIPSVSGSGPSLDVIGVPLNDIESLTVDSKDASSQFPVLPAPSPLRKSIRILTEATSSSLPSATPAPPLGKRTSWLMKAREVKALEGVMTRSSAFNTISSTMDSCPPNAPTLKRKSGEMLGNLHNRGKTGERKSKAPRTTGTEVVPHVNRETEIPVDEELTSLKPELAVSVLVSPRKHSGDHAVQIDEGFVPLNDNEGCIGQFKRTVECLGARSAKSMTKSLGDGAVAALAEARAAAEARVAERNKVEEIDNTDNTPELTLASAPRPQERWAISVSSLDNSKGRLSVSELVSDNEKSCEAGTHLSLHGPQSQMHSSKNASTTPPNSPSDRNTGFVKPVGPVFTKQPVSTTAVPIKSAAPIAQSVECIHNNPASVFTLPAPIVLGVTPRFVSPTFSLEKGAENRKVVSESIAASNALDIDDAGYLESKQGESADSPDADDSVMDASELGDVRPEQSTVITTESTGFVRSNSRLGTMSTVSSSQSETGFFGQATKLVTSILGGGKKVKPEVKSLQMAAAAAKKQQEEADKKALRLKEMEARRQATLAKKAEEERARTLEEEKKIKEESEKRKREREEHTDKRPLKLPTAATRKVEEDTTKKRKIIVDTEKRLEVKKPLSKDKRDPPPSKPIKSGTSTPTTKTGTGPKFVRSATTALVSSATYNAMQNLHAASTTKSTVPEAKPFRLASVSHKGKAKAKEPDDAGDRLPSAMVQTQMAARAKAQMDANRQQVPEVPSESIELPDINSEYSDSEDEDRVRTFDPPAWAQSPELRQALQMQSTVNPDEIFGAIRPLRMEEMFRTRQSRFRARTSSANWSGADRLTVDEIREYERRMGFQPQAS
ncbi:hypothetical protein ID866_2414 [Astraeus odoratus]|nr:hypothetical protein ID866_2414 [Astraeus odoratus]